MGGYRQDNFDLDAEDPKVKPAKGSWWKVLLGTLAYMIPLFWLWNRTDYPDSLGVTITAHGKAGLLENWYYSYLLVERHRVMDDLTFLYMWAPILGLIAWFAAKRLRKVNFFLYSDDSKGA